MKIFIDTEFHEFKKKKINTIELISLALVKETGEKLYLVNKEFSTIDAWDNIWLRNNVLKDLPLDEKKLLKRSDLSRFISEQGRTLDQIKNEVLEFVGNELPEFWGYYCDYDWVVFCWLFGQMIDLPKNFPKYCNDLKQVVDSFGVNKLAVKEISNKYNSHNALEDALFNKNLWEYINNGCQ
jgi:hypothetical protein